MRKRKIFTLFLHPKIVLYFFVIIVLYLFRIVFFQRFAVPLEWANKSCARQFVSRCCASLLEENGISEMNAIETFHSLLFPFRLVYCSDSFCHEDEKSEPEHLLPHSKESSPDGEQAVV